LSYCAPGSKDEDAVATTGGHGMGRRAGPALTQVKCHGRRRAGAILWSPLVAVQQQLLQL